MVQRIHPDDSSQHQLDLSCLTNFLAELLNYPEEILEAKVKDDITRVVNNLKFIKVNLDYLTHAVEHKHDAAIYANEQDRANGVLRDFDGTSMHVFNYENADKAHADLTDLIAQFEAAITFMREKNKLLHFAKCIEYDKDKGCIEARVIRALVFAAKFKGEGVLDLDDLFHECSESYQFANQPVFINRRHAHFYFKPYLGLTCNQHSETKIISSEVIDDYLSC